MSGFDPAQSLIPTEDFIKIARQQGIDINHRTLRLYASQGLLPHAVVRNLAAGGRSGFYPQDVLQTLFLISLLKERGHTLKDIQGLLGRLGEVARQRGVPPTVVHADLAMTFEGGDEIEPLAGKDYWRPISRLVAEELVRRGRRAGQEDIESIELVVRLRDSDEELPILLYLSLEDVAFRRLGADDREQLTAFIAGWTHPEDLEDGLIAEWSGLVLGYGELDSNGIPQLPGRLTIAGPYVRPGYRGQGIGSKLLQALLSKASERGAAVAEMTIPAESTTLGPFISKNGFSLAGAYWQVVHPLERIPSVPLPQGYHLRAYRPGSDAADLASLARKLSRGAKEPSFSAEAVLRNERLPGWQAAFQSLSLICRGDAPVGLQAFSPDGRALLELCPEESAGPIYEGVLGVLLNEAAKRSHHPELRAWIGDSGHDAVNRAVALGFEIEQHLERYEHRLASTTGPGGEPLGG
ncbi:MAG TPA: GNAT family N-acetyltransferase [Bacillota bacterium]